MARLAQYWLMDFYSRVLDQRISIIGKIRNRIMMGQTRQTSDDLTEHEEQDRCAAGYIYEPKNESYLPSSVHGSPSHMSALAKNAFILVSEFVCPHVFLTTVSSTINLREKSKFLPFYYSYSRPLREVRCFGKHRTSRSGLL